MLISYKLGQGSIVLRIKIRDSSVSTGAGLTGLTHESAGLIVSTIADNEATATAYTQAAGNIETIATLGTYAAPTVNKCRFKEVDATNHPGVYEIQIADARFAVSSAKSVIVSISGATNCAETDCLIPLMSIDPYDGVRAALTALPNAVPDDDSGLPTSLAMESSVNAQVLDVIGTDTLIDGKTIVATLQYLAAVLAGKINGAGTGTEKAYGLDGSTERVRVTVDGNGNRTSVEYDP